MRLCVHVLMAPLNVCAVSWNSDIFRLRLLNQLFSERKQANRIGTRGVSHPHCSLSACANGRGKVASFLMRCNFSYIGFSQRVIKYLVCHAEMKRR